MIEKMVKITISILIITLQIIFLKRDCLCASVEKFPLSISWYTMFAGGDRKTISDGSRVNAYSSYMEFGYRFYR